MRVWTAEGLVGSFPSGFQAAFSVDDSPFVSSSTSKLLYCLLPAFAVIGSLNSVRDRTPCHCIHFIPHLVKETHESGHHDLCVAVCPSVSGSGPAWGHDLCACDDVTLVPARG